MSDQIKGPWKAHATGQSRSGKPEYEIHWSEDGECVAEIVHGEAAARLIEAVPDFYRLALWIANADDAGPVERMRYRALALEIISKTEVRP